jgi:hypothetical protein
MTVKARRIDTLIAAELILSFSTRALRERIAFLRSAWLLGICLWSVCLLIACLLIACLLGIFRLEVCRSGS